MNFEFEHQVDRLETDSIKWDFLEMEFGTKDIIPFTIADADWPVHQPILDALKERIDNRVLGYTDPRDEYREAVMGWVERRHDWKIEKDWIVPTGGIVPAMSNLLEAVTSCNAGVVVQPPVYDPFYSIIEATGRKILKNDLILDEDGYHMDYDGLEQLCREGAEALILCNPHNPVCRVWKKEELEKLADICHKYGLIVISDEIHWDLVIGGNVHTTLGKFEQLKDRVVVCTSCSKTFNLAGLDTSSLIIPGEEIRGKFQNYLYARYMFAPNLMGLEAVKAAYRCGDEWVDELQAYITQNAQTVCEFMENELPKVKVAKPEGTFLLWLDMREYGLSSEELVKHIAQAGAGLNSGEHYGESYDGFVRMNIACPEPLLKAGLQCIKNALDAL